MFHIYSVVLDIKYLRSIKYYQAISHQHLACPQAWNTGRGVQWKSVDSCLIPKELEEAVEKGGEEEEVEEEAK